MSRRKLLQEVLFSQGQTSDASGMETTGRPPFDWSEERVRDEWVAAAEDGPGDQHINHVYVHVPFCKSICSFCNYKRLRPTSPALMRTWLDRVLGSLRTLEPGVSQHRFHTLYLGGGTPSVLPAPMIRELVHGIDQVVPFIQGGGRRSIELDPAVCSADRIAALRELGFTDFSFGVQSLDKEVNVSHNRGPQTFDLVTRRVREVRDSGVEEVGLDFLFGLDGTTPQQMIEDLRRTLTELEPSRVNVFLLTPTPRYIDRHFGGSFDAFWSHHRGFERAAETEIPALCERFGYELDGKGHYFMLQRRPKSWDVAHRAYRSAVDRLTFAVVRGVGGHRLGRAALAAMGRVSSVNAAPPLVSYTQTVAFQHRPLHLLGLGYSARSRIFGRAYYEYMDPNDDPAAKGPAWYRGHTLDTCSEARSYALYLLRDERSVDLDRFKGLFGMTLEQAAPTAMRAWREAGLIDEHEGRVVLSADGRLNRAQSLAWLLPDAAIETEIARYRNVKLDAPAIERWVSPLGTGDSVGDGFTLVGVESAALVVQDAAGRRLRFRVSPSLRSLRGLELVAEDDDHPGVRRRLTALIRRNGGDSAGIRSRRLERVEGQLAEVLVATPFDPAA